MGKQVSDAISFAIKSPSNLMMMKHNYDNAITGINGNYMIEMKQQLFFLVCLF